MSAKEELIVYRRLLRIAIKALRSIRDYEPGPHITARCALNEIAEKRFTATGLYVAEDME